MKRSTRNLPRMISDLDGLPPHLVERIVDRAISHHRCEWLIETVDAFLRAALAALGAGLAGLPFVGGFVLDFMPEAVGDVPDSVLGLVIVVATVVFAVTVGGVVFSEVRASALRDLIRDDAERTRQAQRLADIVAT